MTLDTCRPASHSDTGHSYMDPTVIIICFESIVDVILCPFERLYHNESVLLAGFSRILESAGL